MNEHVPEQYRPREHQRPADSTGEVDVLCEILPIGNIFVVCVDWHNVVTTNKATAQAAMMTQSVGGVLFIEVNLVDNRPDLNIARFV